MSQKKAQLLNPLGGNINVTGVITASSFVGDGSGLTGVASTDNIQTATQATFLGDVSISGVSTFADAINFSSANTKINAGSGINVVFQQSGSDKIHFDLATQSIRPETAHTGEIGVATYPFKKVTAQNLIATEGVNATGVVTAASGSFSGNVTIGGTLTYQDVTNIDSIGIITAQQGIQVLANGVDVTGIGTFEDRLTYDGSLGQAGGGTVTYTVTVATKDSTHRYNGSGSSNGYVIDNLQAPVLTFTPGRTYRFTNDNTGSHPLKFYLEADKTTLYSTGVTFNDAYTEITVSDTTPAVLHYQCTAHSLMGNSVITQSNIAAGFNVVDESSDTSCNVLFTTDATGTGLEAKTGTNLTFNSSTGALTATSFSGELVGAAVTTSSTGLQATDIDLAGLLREQVTVTAGKLSDNTNIDLQNGMVHLFTTTESTTSTPNLRYNGSTSLNSKMAIGEAISVTLITTAAAGGYSAQLTIDGSAVTENWIGGSAPDAGGSSGVDIYAYTIIKTADATFTVIGSLSKTSA